MARIKVGVIGIGGTGSIHSLPYSENPPAELVADRILVRNRACGICQGTGIWPWRDMDCNSGEPPGPPLLPGHQNAGSGLNRYRTPALGRLCPAWHSARQKPTGA
ncbi:MAG: hypothetical protein QGF67_07960, partial [Lentisphaeria bacterium]|nr:hypothetical protein [Lentisphaeria bacterium]